MATRDGWSTHTVRFDQGYSSRLHSLLMDGDEKAFATSSIVGFIPPITQRPSPYA
ncbi:hypothetical protein CEV32_4850 [Brucella rhizosphaerae]|uniref:Uncharacterized protein n=1 Tax=Brucella rhizosphaerae TaxID=571254 RepID=A0A256FL41_9HYPH|nr:hypothetical protein CEV32_4850 [Brucella rhizosphaerae]